MSENCQSCAGGQYTGISVFGIYDDTTGCSLITVSGSPAVASINTNIVGGEICVTQCTSPWVVNLTEVGGVPIGTTIAGSPAEASLNVFVTGGDVTLTSNTPDTPIYVDITNACIDVCGNSYTVAGSPAVSSLNVFVEGGTIDTITGVVTVTGTGPGGAITVTGTVDIGNTVDVNITNACLNVCGATFSEVGSPAVSSLNTFITGGDVTIANTIDTPIYVDVTNTCLNVCGLTFTTAGSPAESSLNVFSVGGTVCATQCGDWFVNQAGTWTVGLTGATFTTSGSPAESSLNVFVTGGDVTLTSNTPDTPIYVDVTNTCLNVCGATFTTLGSPAESFLNVNVANTSDTPIYVDITGGTVNVTGTVTVTNTIDTPLYVDITNTCLNVCGNTYTTTGSPAETSLNVYITGGMPTPVLELATVVCGPNTYPLGSNQDLSLAPDGALIVVPADEQFACSIQYYSYDSGAAFSVMVSTTAFTPLWSITGCSSGTIVQLLREIQVLTDGSTVLFELIEGGTLTGASFVAGPGCSTVDTSATVVTGGIVVWSGYAAAFPRNYDSLMDCMNGKTYTIAAKSFKGCAKAVAQIRWSEQTSICG